MSFVIDEKIPSFTKNVCEFASKLYRYKMRAHIVHLNYRGADENAAHLLAQEVYALYESTFDSIMEYMLGLYWNQVPEFKYTTPNLSKTKSDLIHDYILDLDRVIHGDITDLRSFNDPGLNNILDDFIVKIAHLQFKIK